jgi:ABC-2 type transport system permease protein
MRFLSILKNRLLVHFSDKLFVLAILILPVLLSSISGYALRKEKLGYVPVFLADEDETESSELLTYRLMNKEGLRVKTGLLKDGEKEVRDDNAEAMIVIGKGFEANLKSGNIDGLVTVVKSPSTYSAELIKEIVASEVLRIYSTDFTYNWLRRNFNDINRSEISERLEEKWQPNPIMTITYEEIEVESKGDGNITIPPFAAASLGLLILFIMLGLLFGSGWLCEEKINGTIQRAMSVKGALRQLFMGNIAALFIMGLFLTIIFTGMQRVFFGVLLIKGPLSFLLIVLYILCVSSISMFMSAVFRSSHQLQASAPVLALVSGIMGGCLWNFAGVPKPLLSIALLTPQGWALRALTSLYSAPDRMEPVLSAALVLGAASIGFIMLSYYSLKRTLRSFGS